MEQERLEQERLERETRYLKGNEKVMDNIIYICSGALGDEMSMSRNILLDLYYQNYITNNIIIYCHKDRFFYIIKYLKIYIL